MTRIVLIGNPNCGKTAIFNKLTGLKQKVANYPGITVDSKSGFLKNSNNSIEVIDFPGTYSITPETVDEKIVANQILTWMLDSSKRPDLIISVVDASNLSRNLFLTSQIIEMGIPTVIALNMIDKVKKEKNSINYDEIKKVFGAVDVVPVSAINNVGLDELQNAIINHDSEVIKFKSTLQLDSRVLEKLTPIKEFISSNFDVSSEIENSLSVRLLTRDSFFDCFKLSGFLDESQLSILKKIILEVRNAFIHDNIDYSSVESIARYSWLDSQFDKATLIQKNIEDRNNSEKVDYILTHSIMGPLIFLGLLYFIFQSIFEFASLPMDFVDGCFGYLSEFLVNVLPNGLIKDLLVEGIVAGVGSVIIFLPQIIILIFFLTLLEDTGYMARVAMMMDRFMGKVGLHGRSVLPLMSGYACAIPGIMAARTIDSWRERLITILVLPLLSCSARLPVYALLIGAFIPDITIYGFGLQGLTLVVMYLLGTFTAFIVAKVCTLFISEKGKSSFAMELPPYRMPMFKSVFNEVYIRGKAFVVNAGKIIMAISIVLWILASFPKDSNGESVSIHESYAGKIGHVLEPVIKPLGYDWKIGIGLLTSFAAREVMVSTLATIYNVEEGEGFVSLTEAMKNDRKPDGTPTYNILVALSLMVFYVYAAQCMATFAVVKNETNSWKWSFIMMAYMSILAYVGAFVVYQGGMFLGIV